jgi:hypothetical protein
MAVVMIKQYSFITKIIPYVKFHHPYDAGNTHLQNVCVLQRDYRALYPRWLSPSVEIYIKQFNALYIRVMQICKALVTAHM